MKTGWGKVESLTTSRIDGSEVRERIYSVEKVHSGQTCAEAQAWQGAALWVLEQKSSRGLSDQVRT